MTESAIATESQLTMALLRKALARAKRKAVAEITTLRPHTGSRFTGDERIPPDDDAVAAMRRLEACVQAIARAEETLT
jgi:hypothetical protein